MLQEGVALQVVEGEAVVPELVPVMDQIDVAVDSAAVLTPPGALSQIRRAGCLETQ